MWITNDTLTIHMTRLTPQGRVEHYWLVKDLKLLNTSPCE